MGHADTRLWGRACAQQIERKAYNGQCKLKSISSASHEQEGTNPMSARTRAQCYMYLLVNAC
jgi:hypothetical protein